MKKTQKGSVTVWVIAILIVVIIVGGIYWHSTQNSNSISASSGTQTQVTQASTSTQTLASVNSSSGSAVSLNQTENATYQVGDLVTMNGTENITLANGSASNSADGLTADLSSRDIIYGDLNNDGFNDAVVLLYTSKGGSKNGTSQYELEMVLNDSGSIKTFRCAPITNDFDVSQYSIKNGLVIDGNQSDLYSSGNLREAYKFDGSKCVAGDVDITTGVANF